MERLRDAVSRIGEEELVNCVLVQEGLRNAFLLQYVDYGENYPDEPKSSRKLAGIRKYFPELIHSESRQGMIISKNAYSFAESDKSADMGRILGFPCKDEFIYIIRHPEEPSVTIEIIVHLAPGGDKDEVQIIVYRCRDLSHFPEAVAFAKRAEMVLKKDPLVGPIVENVEARKTIELGESKRVTRTKSFRKRGRTHRRSQASRKQRGAQVLK